MSDTAKLDVIIARIDTLEAKIDGIIERMDNASASLNEGLSEAMAALQNGGVGSLLKGLMGR